jgi:8-oxo-dGTP diphosphatase
MTGYTIGIVFNKQLTKIILCLKNRPEWQKGLYNFPGGHIELGESAISCIVREFEEECGIKIPELIWRYIGDIENIENYYVRIFTAKILEVEIFTQEDQPVMWIPINKLPKNIITNLSWLIPFAINYLNKGNNPDNISFGTFEYSYLI